MTSQNGWSDCPSALLLGILLHLDLQDRLQASRACRQWRGLFCTPQAPGSTDTSMLVGQLCLNIPATACRLQQQQDTCTEGLYLCRWLAQRAWAISSLSLRVAPTDNNHVPYNRNCEEGCKSCTTAASLLTSLVHSLGQELAPGRLCMDMRLEPYAGAANVIYSQAMFSGSFLTNLAHHLTSLQITVTDACAGPGHFADMCRLTRLTSLCCIRSTRHHTDPGLITSAITALRSLERFKLIIDPSSQGLWESTLPPELSDLPCLRDVTCKGTGDPMPVVASAPGLHRLRLDCFPPGFPASLAPMTALREICIGNDAHETELDSPFDAFSTMHSLTRLELRFCEFPDGNEPDLLQAIRHLTNLEYIDGLSLDLQVSYPRLKQLSQFWPGEDQLDASRMGCVSGLTSLELYGYLELGGSWSGLYEVLPHLEALKLSCWREWSEESKPQLQALQALTARTELALKSVLLQP